MRLHIRQAGPARPAEKARRARRKTYGQDQGIRGDRTGEFPQGAAKARHVRLAHRKEPRQGGEKRRKTGSGADGAQHRPVLFADAVRADMDKGVSQQAEPRKARHHADPAQRRADKLERASGDIQDSSDNSRERGSLSEPLLPRARGADEGRRERARQVRHAERKGEEGARPDYERTKQQRHRQGAFDKHQDRRDAQG